LRDAQKQVLHALGDTPVASEDHGVADTGGSVGVADEIVCVDFEKLCPGQPSSLVV
jgi:hypothetical protein